MEYERASHVPSGLIACRIGGETAAISEITPRSVSLHCNSALPDSAQLQFAFYRPEKGAYESLTVHAVQDGQVRSDNGCGSVRFHFDDAACAAMIRRTLAVWSEYVQMKITSGPESFAEKYLGYPKDTEEYFSSADAQYEVWFSDFRIDSEKIRAMEVALVLDAPSLWNAFINLPINDFTAFYTMQKHLPPSFFDFMRIKRLYIGSEHCFLRFPDEKALTLITEKASQQGIRLSFVTSPTHQSQVQDMQRRLDDIARIAPGSELIANDWGVLKLLQSMNGQLTPVLGTLLNRFRRDPRMQWKAGIREKGALLRQNALNDPAYYAFLKSLGINRFEYACSPQMQLPEGTKSLHFPFYTTNVSAYCPLKAYIETGSRGAQREDAACPGYCESNALLYPKALNMIHRGRSIAALEEIFPDVSFLSEFDRLVFNF